MCAHCGVNGFVEKVSEWEFLGEIEGIRTLCIHALGLIRVALVHVLEEG